MIEIIDKNKLFNAVIETNETSVNFSIQSKDGKENYNDYIDWQYLGFDEYEIGIADLMIICESEVSVNIEELDKSILDQSIKQIKKTFTDLYKSNKESIIEFIEDVL